MGFNFSQTAKEATTLSELMADRQKVSTNDIVKEFPDGVTVTGFDFVSGKDGNYPIFVFKESEKSFFSGGIVLDKIARKWLDGFGGDLDKCNEELEKSGGVKIKLIMTRTKGGNNLTNVEIL